MASSSLAIVQTVVRLTSIETSSLTTQLSRIFNRPVKIKNQLNRQILGGMIIRLDDQVIDISLRTRLQKIQAKLSL